MTRLPSRLRNSDNSPLVPAEQRKIRQRQRKRTSAMLPVALDYASVGLPVFPLWPGGNCPNSPRQGNATTDTDRILAWWTRWMTANVGVGLGRTRVGQAS